MKWDLTYLFPTQKTFDEAYEKTLSIIDNLTSFKGKLGDESSFREYFLLKKEIQKTGLRVYQYASLKSDLNKKDTKNASQLQKVQIAFSKLGQATAFEEPELIALGKEKVFEFIDKNEDLEEFRFNLKKLFRRQEHILDDKSESLIANYSQLASSGRDLYGSLSVADVEGTDVMLDSGDIVTITNSNYRAHIQKSNSPKERKDIFEAVFDYYADHKNTYASIYKSVLEADYARMKNRNYASCLESYLFGNNIPTDVYTNLTDVARNNTDSVKKYLRLRKETLGLETHHTYDRFLNLVETDKEYDFDEARDLFFESINHFPDHFRTKANDVLKKGFVDVYEQPGKRTGAYSSSMPDLHPFILLNYSKTLADVFTVAHESGHSMHSMYAAESQPSSLQNYTIFVAEVASTFNEHNLLDYFIHSDEAAKKEKIALLQRAIDDIMGTFFRQTLFAIYELEAHMLIENNQPITEDALSDIMINLYKEFYDIDITAEEVKEYVWAYIPHLFYTPFYVYQYATSFAASLKIYENVKEEKKNAFDDYINLLRSGGSDYPVNQLKDAGVDLTDKQAFQAVIDRMEELVDELELVLNNE